MMSCFFYIFLFLFSHIKTRCIGDDRQVDKYCYHEEFEEVIWTEAEKKCEEYPDPTTKTVYGHLVTYKDGDEESQTIQLLQIDTGQYWIGFHNIFDWVSIDKDHFISTDGSMMELVHPADSSTYHNVHYDYWYVRISENSTCYYADFDRNGHWIPSLCHLKKKYICKYLDPIFNVEEEHPTKWDNVINYEITYYYRRAYCDFRTHLFLCPDQLMTCHGKKYDENDVCQGRGSCAGYDRCECSSDWNGPNCDFHNCYGKFGFYACSGRGLCEGKDSCMCNNEKYHGEQCELTFCNMIESNNENVCSGRGNCVDYNKCECNPNFYGKSCEITKCEGKFTNESDVCGGINQGICNPNYFGCDCKTYFHGKECQLTTCFGFESNDHLACNGGLCIFHDSCECHPLFTGESCHIPLCNGVKGTDSGVCGGMGICNNENTCLCEDFWGGPNCNHRTCYGKGGIFACSGHGNCTKKGGKFKCDCNSGYNGEECEIFSCGRFLSTDQFACSGHGVCTSISNCECGENYGGQNCEFLMCNGKSENEQDVCSGFGRCNDDHTCTCNTNLRAIFSIREGINCEQSTIMNIFSTQFPWTLIGIGTYSVVFFLSFIVIYCNLKWIINVRKGKKGKSLKEFFTTGKKILPSSKLNFIKIKPEYLRSQRNTERDTGNQITFEKVLDDLNEKERMIRRKELITRMNNKDLRRDGSKRKKKKKSYLSN